MNNQVTANRAAHIGANPFAIAALSLLIGLCALFIVAGTAHAAEQAAPAKDPAQVAQLAKGKNCTGKANTKTVFRYGWFNGKQIKATKKTVKAYDVTGDQKADTLKVVVGGASDNSSRYLRISVNGKAVKTIKAKTGGSNALVQVVTLKNKAPFIYVRYTGTNADGTYALYQYRSGKLAQVLCGDDIPSKFAAHRHIKTVKPVGNVVRVTYQPMTYTAGSMEIRFAYAYNKAKKTLKLSNPGGYVRARDTFSSGKMLKTVTASQGMTAYTSPSMGKVAFRIYFEDEVTFLGANLSKGRLMFKVKVLDDVGWLPAFTETGPSKGTYFEETGMAG